MGQRASDSSLICPKKRRPLSTYNQRPDYLLNRGEPLGRQTLDRASLEEHRVQRSRLSETHLFTESLLFSCGNNGHGSAAIMDSEPSREQRGCGTEAVADWLTLEAAWTWVFGWYWRRLVYCKELWPK